MYVSNRKTHFLLMIILISFIIINIIKILQEVNSQMWPSVLQQNPKIEHQKKKKKSSSKKGSKRLDPWDTEQLAGH